MRPARSARPGRARRRGEHGRPRQVVDHDVRLRRSGRVITDDSTSGASTRLRRKRPGRTRGLRDRRRSHVSPLAPSGNSRIGFRVNARRVERRCRTSALLEMDFLGNQPPNASEGAFLTNPTFRIRHFKFDIEYAGPGHHGRSVLAALRLAERLPAEHRRDSRGAGRDLLAHTADPALEGLRDAPRDGGAGARGDAAGAARRRDPRRTGRVCASGNQRLDRPADGRLDGHPDRAALGRADRLRPAREGR